MSPLVPVIGPCSALSGCYGKRLLRVTWTGCSRSRCRWCRADSPSLLWPLVFLQPLVSLGSSLLENYWTALQIYEPHFLLDFSYCMTCYTESLVFLNRANLKQTCRNQRGIFLVIAPALETCSSLCGFAAHTVCNDTDKLVAHRSSYGSHKNCFHPRINLNHMDAEPFKIGNRL